MTVQRREALLVDKDTLCPALRCIHNRQVKLRRERFGLQLQDPQRVEVVAEEVTLRRMIGRCDEVFDEGEGVDTLGVVVFFVGLAENEDPLCVLCMHREELFALRAVTVEDDEAVFHSFVLYLRHQAFANFLCVLLGENDDGLPAEIVALTDDCVNQHIVRAEKEDVVVDPVTQQAAAISRRTVLDDVAQDGNEHTGDQNKTKEVDDDLEDHVPVGFVDKLAGCEDELNNLAEREMETKNCTEPPEKKHQNAYGHYHPEDLTSLSLTQQAVKTITKFIHNTTFCGAKLLLFFEICKFFT